MMNVFFQTSIDTAIACISKQNRTNWREIAQRANKNVNDYGPFHDLSTKPTDEKEHDKVVRCHFRPSTIKKQKERKTKCP